MLTLLLLALPVATPVIDESAKPPLFLAIHQDGEVPPELAITASSLLRSALRGAGEKNLASVDELPDDDTRVIAQSCATASCARQLAQRTQTPQVYFGKLSRLGDSYVICFSRLDGKTGLVVADTVGKVAVGQEDELVEVTEAIAKELTRSLASRAPAELPHKSSSDGVAVRRPVLKYVMGGVGGLAMAGATSSLVLSVLIAVPALAIIASLPAMWLMTPRTANGSLIPPRNVNPRLYHLGRAGVMLLPAVVVFSAAVGFAALAVDVGAACALMVALVVL